jgi:hypothetical protein
MKLALKYGLLITAVVVAWVLLTRFMFPLAPDSSANVLAPILFNLTAIAAIFLGVRARKEELGGEVTFKQGLNTGIAISLVYALTSSLFFAVLLLIVGPRLLAQEPMALRAPVWQVAALAFAGMLVGSFIFGVIYSTVVSFIFAKRRPRELPFK